MQTFEYEVQGDAGLPRGGVIEAASPAEATQILRGQGMVLLSLRPVSKPANWLETLRKLNVSSGPGLKDVQNFSNQLAVMIKAGINIRNAIEGAADQAQNPKFKKILEQIKADVESGRPFSDALTREPKIFSPLYVNMVRASELSGNFGHMLERISAYQARQIETRNMVRGAMIYPVIIAVMAVVTTVFLLTFVLPRFTTLFAGKEDLLPTPTKLLMAISLFLRTYWYGVIAAVGATIAGISYAIKTPAGVEIWDRLKLRLPLIKRMFRALYITRGVHTMGELVSAGVPMLETLGITAAVSGNSVYRRLWQTVEQAVRQGEKIATTLQKRPELPRNVIQMISAGEESGQLGRVLGDISEYYAKELRDTIKAVTGMIEPIMILIMGVLVGFIAMSIILPIFKMSSLVK
ncbi:MAG: type II secretion system F family protein [Planctomycetota bacterium]